MRGEHSHLRIKSNVLGEIFYCRFYNSVKYRNIFIS